MAKTRILREFSLDKIAAVDRPCQEHAKVAIIKRADPAITSALPGMGAALRKMDLSGARGFAEILAANEVREKCWEAERQMWPLFDALRDALSSIAADQNLDASTKLSRVEESVNQFIAALKTEWPDVAEEIAKIAKASPNADRMSAFIKAGSASATEEVDMSKTVAELEKELGELQKKYDEVVVKNTTLETDIAKAKENPFVDEEEKPTKKGLEFIEKHRPAVTNDEVLKVGDIEVRKSAVGEASFVMLKAQQTEIAKERDNREMAVMEKRAGEEFPSLVGTSVEKAKVLKALAAAGPDIEKAGTAILTAAEKATKGAFETVGAGGGKEPTGGDIAKAKETFMAKVAEIQSRDKISKTSAMQKAQTEAPELFKEYQTAEVD